MGKAQWQKEKDEHPWLTKTQAKRVARDHAAKKEGVIKCPGTEMIISQ